MASPGLTATTLAAEAAQVLADAGYQLATPQQKQWPAPGARIYEDPYRIVALVVYETWADLSSGWLAAQEALVGLISSHFKRGEPKTWEGYLLLFTPSVVPTVACAEAVAIERNIAHVRKILGTGDDLREPSHVRDALLPLTPLDAIESISPPRAALDILPELLAARGISEAAAQSVVQAFLNEEPIVDRLHAQIGEHGRG